MRITLIKDGLVWEYEIRSGWYFYIRVRPASLKD